ncbi:MAG: DUF2778 domain-containing protein [Alphaproteobacteria bacterium]|nr:DUF2778 domain-containing protein [Alphaproteobacteria bacterium]
MKKIFLMFFCAVMIASGARANTSDPDVILYQADNQIYFLAGDILEQLKNDASDTCLEHVLSQSGERGKSLTVKMYELLLSQCRQHIATMSGKLKDYSGWFEIDEYSNQTYVSDDKIAAYIAGLKNRKLNENVNSQNVIDKYNLCIITKQDLENRLRVYTETMPQYSYTIDANIDACINSIKVEGNENLCPLSPTVRSAEHLEKLKGLNDLYANKTFSFDTNLNLKSGQILLFDGDMLVACDNGRAVHIIRPSFSGYEECRDTKYQSYPGVGVVPDGVYSIKKDGVQLMANQRSWGRYRIPLNPANETETYGRANFYFHGTSDPNKRRSGGCLSLGVYIDDFIDGDWFQNNVNDLMIIVNTH